MSEPVVKFVGTRGVILTVGGETVSLRGDNAMSREDLVAAAAARLSGEQSVVVRKPGDIVINVPAMKADAAGKAPKGN